MAEIDVFAIQQSFSEQNILLVFNGPLSASLIEEIGKALRLHIESQQEAVSSAIDVFGVFIEMTQNIRHYGKARNAPDVLATIAIARDPRERYVISAGNYVETADGEALDARIKALRLMDKAALRAAYKERLRAERAPGGGAGLGLLDMARKASEPITSSLKPLSAGRAFFSLTVVI